MKILTIFDRRLVEDGWRKRIEDSFSVLPDTEFTHTDDVAEAVRLLRKRESRIVVFGSLGGKEGAYLSLTPYLRPDHVPILLTGDLEKSVYTDAFRQRTGRMLHVLDTVNYYQHISPLLETIGAQLAGKSGETRG